MAGKTCAICGKPSGMYPLCKDCLTLKDEGKIIKCTKCNKWHFSNKKCDCENTNTQNEQSQCVICSNPTTKDKKVCTDCYIEINDYLDNIDKNSTQYQLTNYYFNLKDSIYRIQNIEYAKNHCRKLIALALIHYNSHKNKKLIERVYDDIEKLLTEKQKKLEERQKKLEEKQKNNEVTESPSDENIPTQNEDQEETIYQHYSKDGHALDSDMEVVIDDILYNAEIFHSCHNLVSEIDDKNYRCDWFIPILGVNQGVYIEYFGYTSKQKDYDEKEKDYKEFDIPYVIIRKNDPKNDRQRFEHELKKEIKRVAEKHFGYMPKWKK